MPNQWVIITVPMHRKLGSKCLICFTVGNSHCALLGITSRLIRLPAATIPSAPAPASAASSHAIHHRLADVDQTLPGRQPQCDDTPGCHVSDPAFSLPAPL